MGRKKKSYKSERKTFYITDIIAYNICKRKKINLSEEVTRFIQMLAYCTKDIHRQESVLLLQIKLLEDERNVKIEEVKGQYDGLRRATSRKLARVQMKIKEKKFKQERLGEDF